MVGVFRFWTLLGMGCRINTEFLIWIWDIARNKMNIKSISVSLVSVSLSVCRYQCIASQWTVFCVD